MALSIRGSVGIADGAQCFNFVDDQSAIISLLDQIPDDQGGTGDDPGEFDSPRPGFCSQDLHQAILDFQGAHATEGLFVDGHVDPNQATLALLNRLADATFSQELADALALMRQVIAAVAQQMDTLALVPVRKSGSSRLLSPENLADVRRALAEAEVAAEQLDGQTGSARGTDSEELAQLLSRLQSQSPSFAFAPTAGAGSGGGRLAKGLVGVGPPVFAAAAALPLGAFLVAMFILFVLLVVSLQAATDPRAKAELSKAIGRLQSRLVDLMETMRDQTREIVEALEKSVSNFIRGKENQLKKRFPCFGQSLDNFNRTFATVFALLVGARANGGGFISVPPGAVRAALEAFLNAFLDLMACLGEGGLPLLKDLGKIIDDIVRLLGGLPPRP